MYIFNVAFSKYTLILTLKQIISIKNDKSKQTKTHGF